MIPPRTRTLTLLALVPTLALLLAGCSRHTALTLKADLVAFLDPASKQATVSYSGGSTTIELPPNSSAPQAGTLVDLQKLGVPSDTIQNITGLALDFAASVQPDSAIGAGNATLFIAGASETNVFQSQYAVGTVPIPALPANQATAIAGSFQLDAQQHPAALAKVQSGSFRLGVQLQATASSGGQARLDVTRLLVSVSLPPGWGLP
ncbi:MAG: hypothetical protein P8Y02_08365 [Deinococcales bacterium]|jgi:hypothetical protein